MSISKFAAALTLALCTSAALSIATEPTLFGQVEIPFSWPANSPCATSEDGQVAFRITDTSSQNGGMKLHSVDVSTGGTFDLLDSLSIETYETGFGMYIAGDRAYLLPNLTIVDISDPSNLTVIGSISEPVSSRINTPKSAVQGTTVYTLAYGKNVDIYDCADPSDIQYLGRIQLDGDGSLLSVDTLGDDKLIFGRSFRGVSIHDSSTLGSLPIVGSVTGFSSNSVEVNEDLDVAYAFRRDTSAQILTSIDITDPTNPTVLGSHDLNDLSLFSDSGPIAAIGDTVVAMYVEYGSIEILDVTNPSNMLRMDPISVESENVARVDSDSLLVETRTGLSVYNFTVCEADLNADGSLNFLDISAYLAAYAAMDPLADFTDDGNFNFLDVSAYLAAFSTGCP
ncbi:MAG: GC-type dockerin domain-anchored protein [Phycisphaerales bacterium]